MPDKRKLHMQSAPTLPLLIECTAWTLSNKGGTGMLEESWRICKDQFYEIRPIAKVFTLNFVLS